jgi:hypothetical protein
MKAWVRITRLCFAWFPGYCNLGGQALLVKGMEAQKAGRNEEALKLLNIYVDRYPQVGRPGTTGLWP